METLNFLPPQPVKNKSDKWRSIIAVAVIFLGLGSFFAYQKIKFFASDWQEISKTFQDISASVVKDLSGKSGGDVTVEPPPQIQPRLPELHGEMFNAEKFSAQAIIVKDENTGAVLFKKNEYQKRPIASITKLMSALVILEKSINWSTSTKVTSDDVVDTHMYAGETYTLEELWNSALIGSSNKAIITLADVVGLPREAFIERMNDKAKELGMGDSVFVDPSGIAEGNIASASDVAILINEAMKSDKIRQTLLSKEFTVFSKEKKQKHHMWNTDWLLLGWVPNSFSKFNGGKTGYIGVSGYNFAMQVGDEQGHLINVVVLGSDTNESRFTEAKEIAEWVFKNYKWPEP